MTSFLDGARRVAHAPLLIAGIYLLTALTAVPLGLIVSDAVESHAGDGVTADNVVSDVDGTWWEGFEAQSSGVAGTGQPHIIGLAAVLWNLSDLLDAEPLHGSAIMAMVAYLVVWAFLIGGLLDRLARQLRVGTVGFFAACGVYFFRFCRLAVMAGVVYAVLFTLVHTWLLDDLYTLATRNVDSEHTAFAIRGGLYTLIGLLLLAVNLVFDYAKIRAVVEDRRSMVGAALAAIRFVRRRPADVVGLYLLNSMVFLVILAVYAGVATGQSSWLGVLVGQAYVVARLFATLVFYASQTAYFQSQLAHATYVAAPQPRWPHSRAAEALSTTAR